MDTAQMLLGLLYLLLGIAFLATRSRFSGRSRALALAWLFLGVMLTSNGVLRMVQAATGA
jgi:hypothetical protein